MGSTLVGCAVAGPPSSGGGGASSGGGSGGSGSPAPTPAVGDRRDLRGLTGLDGPGAGGRNAVSGSACIDWRDEPRGAGWRRPPALPPMSWSMIGATPETPIESVSCAPVGPLGVDPARGGRAAVPALWCVPCTRWGCRAEIRCPAWAVGARSWCVGHRIDAGLRAAVHVGGLVGGLVELLPRCAAAAQPARRPFAPASAAEPTPPVAACMPSPKATSAPRPNKPRPRGRPDKSARMWRNSM